VHVCLLILLVTRLFLSLSLSLFLSLAENWNCYKTTQTPRSLPLRAASLANVCKNQDSPRNGCLNKFVNPRTLVPFVSAQLRFRDPVTADRFLISPRRRRVVALHARRARHFISAKLRRSQVEKVKSRMELVHCCWAASFPPPPPPPPSLRPSLRPAALAVSTIIPGIPLICQQLCSVPEHITRERFQLLARELFNFPITRVRTCVRTSVPLSSFGEIGRTLLHSAGNQRSRPEWRDFNAALRTA